MENISQRVFSRRQKISHAWFVAMKTGMNVEKGMNVPKITTNLQTLKTNWLIAKMNTE